MRHPVKNTLFSYLSQVPRHIKGSCYVILWDSQDKILAYCWFEPYIFIYYLTLLNCWHYVSNIENYERKKSKFVKNLWLEIAKLSSNSNFNSVCSWDSLTLSPTGGVGGNLSSFAIAQKQWELGRWFFLTFHSTCLNLLNENSLSQIWLLWWFSAPSPL